MKPAAPPTAGPFPVRRSPLPEAAIPVHETGDRLRVRVPSRRYDRYWFETVCRSLRAQPGVLEVSSRPSTGSISIRFDTARKALRRDSSPILAAVGLRIAVRRSEGGATHGANAQERDPAMPIRAANGPRFGLVQDRRIRREHLALAVLAMLLLRNLIRSGWMLPGLALIWFLLERFPELRPDLRPALRHLGRG
jgi:hypothetical protein